MTAGKPAVHAIADAPSGAIEESAAAHSTEVALPAFARPVRFIHIQRDRTSQVVVLDNPELVMALEDGVMVPIGPVSLAASPIRGRRSLT